MKKYYLIGQNTDNSLSPAIHHWIYSQYNIAALYSSKNINSSQFESEISNIHDDMEADSIHGINITIPYKSLAPYKSFFPSISVSLDSMCIDAINCIYKVENKIIGDNTDWYGFIKSLESNSINISNYSIIILGSGGASRAVVYGLQKLGISNFKIYNRSQGNIKVNNIKYSVRDIQDLIFINDLNLFIINCLPIGIVEDYFILLNKIISQVEIFYDLNYIESEIHDIMKLKDIKVIDGLDMLIYQAVKSVELWSNKKIMDTINTNDIRKYLLELK